MLKTHSEIEVVKYKTCNYGNVWAYICQQHVHVYMCVYVCIKIIDAQVIDGYIYTNIYACVYIYAYKYRNTNTDKDIYK